MGAAVWDVPGGHGAVPWVAPAAGHGFTFPSQNLGSAAWQDEPRAGQSSPVPGLGRLWGTWLSCGCHHPGFTDREVEAELGKGTQPVCVGSLTLLRAVVATWRSHPSDISVLVTEPGDTLAHPQAESGGIFPGCASVGPAEVCRLGMSCSWTHAQNPRITGKAL